jgi:hypothetical protein
LGPTISQGPTWRPCFARRRMSRQHIGQLAPDPGAAGTTRLGDCSEP